MLGEGKERTYNIIAWGGNVVAAVFLIFCNKVLMNDKNGYGFHFATTLSALHYVCCTLAMQLVEGGKGGNGKPAEPRKLPLKDLIIFTIVSDISICSINLSLLLNTVSTYQIAKLLVIPFVAMVECFFFGSTLSNRVLGCILLVVVGVGTVTVDSLNLDATVLGLTIAGVSVVAVGMQQILVRQMQQWHNLTANEMLACIAPAQAITLLLFGPPTDKLVSGTWVFQYRWFFKAVLALVFSCAAAVAVNVTQFMCLGRFSAVSFQVLGHSKTILVLLGSWLFLKEATTAKKLLGMSMAVVGMVLYGYYSMREKEGAKPPTPLPTKEGEGDDEEAEKLLDLKADAHMIPVLEEEPPLKGPGQPPSSRWALSTSAGQKHGD